MYPFSGARATPLRWNVMHAAEGRTRQRAVPMTVPMANPRETGANQNEPLRQFAFGRDEWFRGKLRCYIALLFVAKIGIPVEAAIRFEDGRAGYLLEHIWLQLA